LRAARARCKLAAIVSPLARAIWVLVACLALAGAGKQAASARRTTVPFSDAVFLALGQGDYARAETLSAEWLASAKPGSVRHAEALQARLDVAQELGTLKDARELEAAIGALAPDAPGAATLKANLAIALALAPGKADAARALALAQEQAKSPEADAAARADARYAEARALNALGRNDAVRDPAIEALAAFTTATGKRARGIEVMLHRLIGRSEQRASRLEPALAEYRQSVTLANDEFGEDSLLAIRAQTSYAGVLEDLGRLGEARAVREGVLAASRRRFGERHLETAKSEAYVGSSLETIGDYEAAREHFERASAIVAELPDAPAADRAQIANNHANLLQEMDRIEPALRRYREALEATAEVPELARVRAVILANVGNTEFKMGRYDDADRSFRSALALREQTDGKDAPGLAYALEGLASTALVHGRYAEAEPDFRRAVSLRARVLPKEHPILATAMFGLALARYGQGDLAEAFELAETAALNQQALRTLLAPDLSERQSVAYRNQLVPTTALAVTLAAARGDPDSIARAWRLVMIDRGLVARTERRRLAAARASQDPQLAQAFQRWRLATSRLSEAWLGTSAGREQLERLHEEVELAERALGGGARAGAQADLGAAPLDALAKALPPDGLLVAYAEGVAPTAQRVLAAGRPLEPEDWYAFVLGPDGKPKLQRAGRIDALAAQVRGWYACCAIRPRRPRRSSARARP
jgi:tetratricopeptide (TPR) repeat protein